MRQFLQFIPEYVLTKFYEMSYELILKINSREILCKFYKISCRTIFLEKASVNFAKRVSELISQLITGGVLSHFYI